MHVASAVVAADVVLTGTFSNRQPVPHIRTVTPPLRTFVRPAIVLPIISESFVKEARL
jgi:hypothetical protein